MNVSDGLTQLTAHEIPFTGGSLSLSTAGQGGGAKGACSAVPRGVLGLSGHDREA